MASALKSPLARDPQDARHSPALHSPLRNGPLAVRGNPFGLAARHAALLGNLPQLAGASAPALLNFKARQNTPCRQADVFRASTPRHECRSFHANSMKGKPWNGRAGNQPEQLRQGRA